MPTSNYSKIYAVVRRIPVGKVATYGQVAELAKLSKQPRLVGYALFSLRDEEDDDLPWHRVVNAKGEISYSLARQKADQLQRVLLEAEGVVFNERGRIDLKNYRWQPDVRRHSSKRRSTPSRKK
ncbi:MAG TPA: MGMT family protein [Gemmatales bacterium]|nr:MGMT family protein [Gemmatales bacterium]